MGLIKVPLFLKLPFQITSKNSRLVLGMVLFIFELHFAETQAFYYKLL